MRSKRERGQVVRQCKLREVRTKEETKCRSIRVPGPATLCDRVRIGET